MGEYEKGEFCKAINCEEHLNYINNDERWCALDGCRVYHFHKWLSENGYEIIKNEKLKWNSMIVHDLVLNSGKFKSKIAADLGVSRPTLDAWIGGVKPRGEHLVKLCQYFGKRPDEFFIYSERKAKTMKYYVISEGKTANDAKEFKTAYPPSDSAAIDAAQAEYDNICGSAWEDGNTSRIELMIIDEVKYEDVVYTERHGPYKVDIELVPEFTVG